jgi:hypothetical protein
MATFGMCTYCGTVKPSDNGTGSDIACCGERGHAKVIHTERNCGWSAIFDGYDGAPDAHDLIGLGLTEQAAIENLVEQFNDAEEPVRVRGVMYRNVDDAHDDDVQRQIDEVAP